jgi:uncharacterized protein YjbI with pentapeptide repeats
MTLSRLLGMTCVSLLLAGTTSAQEPKTCPRPEPWKSGAWKPTEKELQRILFDHGKWAEKWRAEAEDFFPFSSASDPKGRANLCNADLEHGDLKNADLAGANLNGAYLVYAKLDSADLTAAELNNANLVGAKLNSAKFWQATMNHALLAGAELNNADLSGVELNNASLIRANLNNATLEGAKLNKAELVEARLENSNLGGVSLAGAQLAHANLTGATYAPVSAAPDPYVAGIKGLDTVTFPAGKETGLVQLRELLQKAGLRDLERQATYAIEHRKTSHAIADWREKPGAAAEGILRNVAFNWTTGYGLYPGRALNIIVALWLVLIPVYFWPIRLALKRPSVGSIYQVWSSDRITATGGNVSLSKSADVNRLEGGTLGALYYAAYFSLLSAFHIGWRDLNVGAWIARLQPREYALRATGWVRVVSGTQSLLSVYLLALWVLTYFGRPFQ